jgi:hypothetical protein
MLFWPPFATAGKQFIKNTHFGHHLQSGQAIRQKYE